MRPLWRLAGHAIAQTYWRDVQRAHADMCALMGGQPAEVGYVWAMLGGDILVRSDRRPPGAESYREHWLGRIAVWLCVQPSKKVRVAADGRELRNSRRVAVDAELWIPERLARAGFRADSMTTADGREFGGWRAGTRITIGRTAAVAIGHVIDADAMNAALDTGIGPGRAYGLGLMASIGSEP